MADIRNYGIRSNRIRKAWKEGMIWDADKKELKTDLNEPIHRIFFQGIDSAKEDCMWGHLSFLSDIPENAVIKLYAFASEQNSFYDGAGEPVLYDRFFGSDMDSSVKAMFFKEQDYRHFVNQKDILLYELRGRYLYLFLEIIADQEVTLKEMNIVLPGDNFLAAFPEIFRQEGEFFHRYLSIFSTMFNGLQKKITNIPQMLDVETAPEPLLVLFGKWMRLDVSGNFLSEEKLRTLIREVYQLNKIKGTGKVLKRIAEIVLGEKVILVEKNIASQYVEDEEKESFDILYGDGPFEATMLIRSEVSSNLRAQLLFLLEQFKPIRCNLHVVFLDDNSKMNSHCYLDVNAKIHEIGEGKMDGKQTMDGAVVLK